MVKGSSADAFSYQSKDIRISQRDIRISKRESRFSKMHRVRACEWESLRRVAEMKLSIVTLRPVRGDLGERRISKRCPQALFCVSCLQCLRSFASTRRVCVVCSAGGREFRLSVRQARGRDRALLCGAGLQQFEPPVQRCLPRQPCGRLPSPGQHCRGDCRLQQGHCARPGVC